MPTWSSRNVRGLLRRLNEQNAEPANVVRCLLDPELGCEACAEASQESTSTTWDRRSGQWLGVYRELLGSLSAGAATLQLRLSKWQNTTRQTYFGRDQPHLHFVRFGMAGSPSRHTRATLQVQ